MAFDSSPLNYIARANQLPLLENRNIGESATLAYAELHSLTACIDDRAARRHGQERGVPLTGTLELVCRGMRANIIEEAEAVQVVDLLRDHEAFLPCDGSTFMDWARTEGFLS